MENPINSWKFWLGRLLRGYFIMAVSCLISFPIAIYLVIPAILWIFADAPYTLATPDQLMKWVRYGLMATVWVGSVSWLSEFLPWLIRKIRNRRNGDTL